MARKGLPGKNWTTDYDFSSLGGPGAGKIGGVRWALSKGYNPYTGERTNKSFQQILAAKRQKDAEEAERKKDPYGVEKAITKYNERQNKDMAAHQAWSKEVGTGLENWLGSTSNIRSDLNQRYEQNAKDLAAPVNLGSNAAQVGGSAGTVMNPNAATLTSATGTHAHQTNAMGKLAEIQGTSAWLSGKDLSDAGMKEFKYKQSQIPKIYNDAKNKYESELREAVRDIEAKKELAMIQAEASMYGSQLGLLGSLAGDQANNQRALLGAQTDIRNTDADNASRERIAMMNASLERWKAQFQGKDGSKDFNEMWSSYYNGQFGEDAAGNKRIFEVGGQGKLLDGAWLGAKALFADGAASDPNIQAMLGGQDINAARMASVTEFARQAIGSYGNNRTMINRAKTKLYTLAGKKMVEKAFQQAFNDINNG